MVVMMSVPVPSHGIAHKLLLIIIQFKEKVKKKSCSRSQKPARPDSASLELPTRKTSDKTVENRIMTR
jgi:hypothetical protein